MPDPGPTWSAKTSEPCTCKNLDRAAQDPAFPVEFDESLNEYHLVTEGGGTAMIYHCYFCGGAAPKSRRDELFAIMDPLEVHRLKGLCQEITSVEAAISAFGAPQEDHPLGAGMEIQGSGVVRHYRLLRFFNLSKTVIVGLIDYGPAGVGFQFEGKRLETTT